jgi:hypothetical protein
MDKPSKRKELTTTTPEEEEEAMRLQLSEEETQMQQLSEEETACINSFFELKTCDPENLQNTLPYPLTKDPEYTNFDENIYDRAISDLVSLGLVKIDNTKICNTNTNSNYKQDETPLKRLHTSKISGDKTAFYQIYEREMNEIKRKGAETCPSTIVTRGVAIKEPKQAESIALAKKSSVAESSTACHFDQKLGLLIAALSQIGIDIKDVPWLVKLVIYDMGPNTYVKDLFNSQEVMSGYIAAATAQGYRFTPIDFIIRLGLDPQVVTRVTGTMEYFRDIQCGRDMVPYLNDDFLKMFRDLKADPNLMIPFVLPYEGEYNRGNIVIEHWANIIFKGYICVGPFSDGNCYLMPIYGIRTAWGCGGAAGYYFKPTSNHLTEIEVIKLICYLNNRDPKFASPEIQDIFNKAFFRQEAAKGHTEHDFRKERELSAQVMQESICCRAQKYTGKYINKLRFNYLTLANREHVLPNLVFLLRQPFINIPGRRIGGSKKKTKRKQTNKRKTNKRRKQIRTNKRRRI